MKPGDDNKKASDSLSSELSDLVALNLLADYAIEIHGQTCCTASGQENEKGPGCMIAGDTIDAGIYHHADGYDRKD